MGITMEPRGTDDRKTRHESHELTRRLIRNPQSAIRNWKSAIESAVVLVDFFLEELDAAGHLGKAFHAILDGDPARVVDLAQNAENGVVIVQTFPDLPVT